MKKIPAKYAHWVFLFFMSLMMSLSISGIMTLRNAGLSAEFPALWLRAFGVSYSIVVPSVLVLAPLARKIAGMVVEKPV